MITENQPRTFISYSPVNKDFALKLARELRADGHSIWIDQLDVSTDARRDAELEKALDESESFLVIITPSAIADDDVKNEIGYAIDGHKRILPVLLETCNMPLRLRKYQHADFITQGYDEGVKSVRHLLGGSVQINETTNITTKTSETASFQKAETSSVIDDAEAERIWQEQKAEAKRTAMGQTSRSETGSKASGKISPLTAQEEAERIWQEQKAEANRRAKGELPRSAKPRAEVNQPRSAPAATKKKSKSLGKLIWGTVTGIVGAVVIGVGALLLPSLTGRTSPPSQQPEISVLPTAAPLEPTSAPTNTAVVDTANIIIVNTGSDVDISGIYQVEGTNADGSNYAGQASITKMGTGYEISWKFEGAPDTYTGMGTLEGKTFSAQYSFNGIPTIVTYEVQDDGTLIGNWEAGGQSGTENLITSTLATIATEEPTPDCNTDFTSSDLTHWPIFYLNPDNFLVESDLSSGDYLGVEDGQYVFDINRTETWAYSTCDAYEYDDVRIDARVENMGRYDINTKLICRYSKEKGWYEFGIFSSGLYAIYFIDPVTHSRYVIKDGGSNEIKTGMSVNEFSAVCQGNTLILYVNGNEVVKTNDDLSKLTSGQIGIGVSAGGTSVPIKGRFDWVTVNQP